MKTNDRTGHKETLTVLSFGGGQDSTALLLKLIHQPDFRAEYAPWDFVAVMSDTGNEHPETYRHTAKILRLAFAKGVEVYVLTSDRKRTAAAMGISEDLAERLGVIEGFHSEAWGDFVSHYDRVREVPLVSGKKSCTANLKVLPIHRFLEQYVGNRYGLRAERRGAGGRLTGKTAIPAFARRYGRIVSLIGISKGEEKRAGSSDEARAAAKAAGVKPAPGAKWEIESIQVRYPLIEKGIDRAGCQAEIRKLGAGSEIPICPPSNCMYCPYLSDQEILWQSRRYPEAFAKWVDMERIKMEKTAAAHAAENAARITAGKKARPNHGVKGARTLTASLARAEKLYGHMTDADLDDYKMSHGHCTPSKY